MLAAGVDCRGCHLEPPLLGVKLTDERGGEKRDPPFLIGGEV
jgi:hypothetical protein